MRDVDAFDSELRLLAAVRRAIGERGRPMPNTEPIEQLLDETPRYPTCRRWMT